MERKIDRFDKYMEYKGLNDNQVTVQLSLSIGTIGKSRKENRDLSNAVVEKILNFYTDLSRKWLIAGEGDMLKDDANQSIIGDNNIQVGNNNSISGQESKRINMLESQITTMKTQLQEKDAQITMLQSQIQAKDAQIDKLLSIISSK